MLALNWRGAALGKGHDAGIRRRGPGYLKGRRRSFGVFAFFSPHPGLLHPDDCADRKRPCDSALQANCRRVLAEPPRHRSDLTGRLGARRIAFTKTCQRFPAGPGSLVELCPIPRVQALFGGYPTGYLHRQVRCIRSLGIDARTSQKHQLCFSAPGPQWHRVGFIGRCARTPPNRACVCRVNLRPRHENGGAFFSPCFSSIAINMHGNSRPTLWPIHPSSPLGP